MRKGGILLIQNQFSLSSPVVNIGQPAEPFTRRAPGISPADLTHVRPIPSLRLELFSNGLDVIRPNHCKLKEACEWSRISKTLSKLTCVLQEAVK